MLRFVSVLALSFVFDLTQVDARPAANSQVYGIHLFFDETEFVDVLTITQDADGQFSGVMHVPNDFDAPLDNIAISEQKIVFSLLVPKNSTRPQDLIFHYEGTFFDPSQSQIIGFVTIEGDTNFVASFVGFKR